MMKGAPDRTGMLMSGVENIVVNNDAPKVRAMPVTPAAEERSSGETTVKV